MRLNLSATAEVQSAIPQITRATAPDEPDASEFSVRLSRLDGSWSHDYTSLEEFNNAGSFKTGAYMLSASYGSLNDEGFGKPCYYGETQVTVLEERTSEAEVTATLASSMVSIGYTDSFKQYFTDWSAEVHTDGHSYIEYSKEETRAAYIAPGTTAIAIEVTDHNNRSVKLQPCTFASVARNHYRITFDVNQGNVGIAQLSVIFDDSLTQEDVKVDLTDELYAVPAPTIHTTGFAPGQNFEIVKGEEMPNRASMTINAPGGLASAVLTFDSENFTPPFGTETELCNAPQNIQSALAQMGIDARGLFRNPEEIGWIDFTGMAAYLPVGHHTVTLLAKDGLDRSSEPVSLSFDIVPIELRATAPTMILGASTAIVNVTYNGTDPQRDITFKSMNDYGQYVDAEVLSVTESSTRAIAAKTYAFELNIPQTERQSIPMKMYLRGEETAAFNIEVKIPEYSVECDSFATHALLKVDPENPSDLQGIVNNIKVVMQGPGASAVTMSRDAANGIVTLYGLTPGSSYTAVTRITVDGEGKEVSFTTEAAAQLPNADFSQSTQTLSIDPINVGGPYTGTALSNPKYQTTSSISRPLPDGWATLNGLTCWSGASNHNSWFVVPSTWVENGQALIRTVGYSHNGTTPGNYKKTGVWYCANTPTDSELTKASGELFLGSYAYNGSASRTDGITWATRPATFSFDYSYAPYNNETAQAYIKVTDASGAVLSQQSLDLAASSAMTTKTVDLTGYTYGKKAAKIEVGFKSTKGSAAVNIPTGSALNEGTGLSNQKIEANSYHALATGSVLRVDNLRLGYDVAGAAKAKKQTNSKKRR